jgi:lysozyme
MKKTAIIVSALLLASLLVLGLLLFLGHIWSVDPSQSVYPVRGIDVSEHQEDIDWLAVAGEGLDFAFIKATEGMDHRDGYFARNWEGAREAGMIRGAYHFFTFRSPGSEQARNFIATVPVEEGTLPPTIDLEFYGNSSDVPAKEEVQRELGDFIVEIERHYGRRPVLYVDYDSYQAFVAGEFEDCIIWIRDLSSTPDLGDGRPWFFWQYSSSGRVVGIDGNVDLNVFNGDETEFRQLMWLSLI